MRFWINLLDESFSCLFQTFWFLVFDLIFSIDYRVSFYFILACYLCRSRNDMEKHRSSHANESRFHDLDENATVTSDSCSWVADENACSSDNQISSVIKGGELQNR